jgi:hypothetical protein
VPPPFTALLGQASGALIGQRRVRGASVLGHPVPVAKFTFVNRWLGSALSSLVLSPAVQYKKRRRYGQSVIAEVGQQPGDEQGTWPRERLIAMDRRFVERMERAIERGLERRPDSERERAA